MKLKIALLLIGLVLGSISHAQIKIGTNPQNINASSVLELESTSRTLVLTRVNSTQMNAIRPLQGALVYNTETKCVHYYDGTQWLNICDALTNSVNISMVDNGDGSYTFTDAVGVETIITTTTNATFEVANDSLVLTDSNNNALSVALDSLNRHTYSTDAIVNIFPKTNGTVINDSTIVIRRTGNNYNFEVGEITGDNIKDGSITRSDYGSSSINGNAHIQNRTIPPVKLIGGLNGEILQTQLTGTPTPTETAVWVSKNGLFTADEISYDPTISGLTNNTVKLALDELATSNAADNDTDPSNEFQNLSNSVNVANESVNIEITDGTNTVVDIRDADSDPNNEIQNAAQVIYSNLTSGLTAIDTQAAIDELATSNAADNDTDPSNEFQNLSNSVNVANESVNIEITDGTNTVVDIRDADSDPNNEIQNAAQVIYSNLTSGLTAIDTQAAIDELATSNAADNDTDPSNEFQNLSNSVNVANESVNIEITDGTNTVVDIRDADSDPNNEIQNAAQVIYSNLTSGLTAIDTQAAIDELATSNAADNDTDPSNEFQNLSNSVNVANESVNIEITDGTNTVVDIRDADSDPNNEIQNAAQVIYSNLTSGLTAIDTQAAIDELATSNAADNDTDPSNEFQNLSNSVNVANESVNIEITDGTNTVVDIRDADSDPNNEIQNAAQVIYSNLTSGLTAIDTQAAIDELATSNAADNDTDPSNEFQNLSNSVNVANESVNIEITDGTNTVVDIRDADSDPNNEIQNAAQVIYSNLTSGLTAIDTQAAIDELATSNAADNDTDPSNEFQNLSNSVNVANESVNIEITDGTNTVVDIRDADSDPANEIQILTRTGTDALLSNGGGTISIADNDNDPANENQTVSQGTGITVTQTDQDFQVTNSAPDLTYAFGKVDAEATSEVTSGVNSVTNNSPGNYSVTFINPRTDTNYIILLTVNGNLTQITNIQVTQQTMSGFDVQVFVDGVINNADWYFSVREF